MRPQLGRDTDTVACSASGIAEPYYRTIPARIYEKGLSILDQRIKDRGGRI